MIRARHAFLLVPMLLLGHAATADAAPKAKAKKGKPVPVVSVTSACTDFYDYANADWLKAHPAPTVGSVSALEPLRANARTTERALLEDLSRGASDDAGRALGALWTDGMNEPAIETAGATPMQPLFDRIGAIRKNKDLAQAIADLHAAGIPVLFNFAADYDAGNPDLRIGYANQGGLGLPDPEFYTRTDAETRDVLGRYRAYIQAVLQQSGTPADQVSEQSGWVLSMEMQLAQNSLPLAQLRDPGNAYHVVTVAELQKAYPHLAFAGFLKTQKVGADSISLAHTGFFAAADGMLANTPVEQWQAYLRFHVASAMAPYLSRGFQDAHFQLYDRLLGGAQQPPDRAQAVMDAIDHALGSVIGHAWAQRYLPPATKEAAVHVASGLRAAMKSAIAGNPWMDDATRSTAQGRLDKLVIAIGEPARIPSTAGLLLGTGYGADMLAVAAWQHRQEMASIGHRDSEGGTFTVSRADRDWPVPADVPDLSYDPLRNRLIVTAAVLQPPVLDPIMDSPQQYGALGSLIGHALHHAMTGNPVHEGWTAASASAFDQRTAPIVAQYGSYAVDEATRVDGNRTRDENLADLGGVELAWIAYKAASPAAVPPKSGQASPDRRFFDAYAALWARKSTAASVVAESATSSQSPAKYRVDGVVTNVPEFAAAYACKAGQPMAATSPVTIWR